MTAETDLLPLPEPVAVKYPDSGLRDDEHALRLWAAHGYDTGGEPLFSAEQLREAVAPLQAEVDALRTRLEDTVRESANKVEALRAEVERLKSMTAVTMGIGSGDGSLFVHGDYDSIKAAQAIVLKRDALRAALEEAEEAMRFVHASCATFPQEPQHVQNAAWRRIVNAITKARAVLEQEEGNGQ